MKKIPLIKYYLTWIISIIVFFSSFFFSENGYISDVVCISIVVLSAIIGIVFFIVFLVRVIKSPKNRSKYFLLIVATFVLFGILAKTNPPVFNYPPNESGLRNTVEKQYKLANQGEQGFREIYKNFIAASAKGSLSEDQFTTNTVAANNSAGITATKDDVHGIYIDGTDGYVDRTIYSCVDSGCTNIKSETRALRKYVYENKHWLMTDEMVACPRKQMYDMDPEFLRAINIIAQRFPSNYDFQQVKNCLKVSYVTNDSDMGGAEGLFNFVPGQSLLELDIFVSPRYKGQSDLLTAFLLAHEGQHAANYGIGLFQGKPVGCYEDEASAFNAQYLFLRFLNQQEKDSLRASFYQIFRSNITPELWNVLSTYDAIAKQPGSDFVTKATSFVKSIPAYQKECAGR